MRFETRHQNQIGFSSSGYKSQGNLRSPGIRRVVSDIVMIAFWGAMIPGFLWIGNAAGF